MRVVRIEYEPEAYPPGTRDEARRILRIRQATPSLVVHVILLRVRAYISGALLNAADLDQSRALYEQFADACRAAGWDAYVPHQHADPVRDAGMPNVEVATRDLEAVRSADALVAYVGEPSLGVGAEVAIALAAGKRVLLVAERNRRVSRFLLGLAELHPELASFHRYDSAGEAAGWITDSLEVTPRSR